MKKMTMSGKIAAKNADTIRSSRNMGGFREKMKIAKAYIATRGALKTADTASAISFCESFRSAPSPNVKLSIMQRVSS